MKFFQANLSKIIRKVIRKVTKSFYQKKYRKKFRGRAYSIISSNCIGGVINNRVGQPQNSPTVNLWIPYTEFIKFIHNLHYYINKNLVFIKTKYEYPVAVIDDVHIHFLHYSTKEQAEECWEKRKKRIIWDNIYIILYEDNLTRTQLLQLSNVECKKLIVLTSSKKNLDLPFIKYIEKDKHGRENDFVFLDTDFLGRMTFEKQWDFVAWLNE